MIMWLWHVWSWCDYTCDCVLRWHDHTCICESCIYVGIDVLIESVQSVVYIPCCLSFSTVGSWIRNSIASVSEHIIQLALSFKNSCPCIVGYRLRSWATTDGNSHSCCCHLWNVVHLETADFRKTQAKIMRVLPCTTPLTLCTCISQYC